MQLRFHADVEAFRAVQAASEHAPGAVGASEIKRNIIAQRVLGLPRN